MRRRVRLEIEALEDRLVPAGTFTFNFSNLTLLPATTKIYVAGGDTGRHLTPAGNFVPGGLANSGAAFELPPNFQVHVDGLLNGARIYFFVGSPYTFGPLPDPTWVTLPGTNDPMPVNDFVELTANFNNDSLTVDTQQVDKLGMPLTVGVDNSHQPVNQPLTVGTTLTVTRAQIIAAFNDSFPGGNPYNPLVMANNQGILNPTKFLSLPQNQGSPLHTIFDAAVTQLFENGATNIQLKGIDNLVYTGTRTTHTATGVDNSPHSYKVLQLQSSAHTLYVYEPFFSSNGHGGAPPAPQWLATLGKTNESSGEQVFGCDGVFADNGVQPGLSGPEIGILGDLELQLAAALNRGTSGLDSGGAGENWFNPQNFYKTGTFNQYAAFMHTRQVNGQLIFINGLSYAFAVDEQKFASKIEGISSGAVIQVTLGPWPGTGRLARLLGLGLANLNAVPQPLRPLFINALAAVAQLPQPSQQGTPPKHAPFQVSALSSAPIRVPQMKPPSIFHVLPKLF